METFKNIRSLYLKSYLAGNSIKDEGCQHLSEADWI